VPTTFYYSKVVWPVVNKLIAKNATTKEKFDYV